MTANNHIELWDKCRSIIRDNIPVEQYDTWFKDINSLKFENDILTLVVPTAFYAEQIEERYLKILAPAIRRVYGPSVQLFYHFYQVNGQPESQVVQKSEGPSNTIIEQQLKAPAANPFYAPYQGNIDSQLNPRYTFENYCGGESNKIVKSIAEAIANDPSNHTFNPLFIFGPVGVGKTHLMQAIGIRLKEKNPQSRVLYVNARLFSSQYTAAVARKNTNSFFYFYQSIDTLLIDDIQDLHDKPGTQNTFFHIFNHLHQNNKQIIMSSDRAPADMEGFEERMLSRFKWGMAAELSKPDIELRREVLAQKAARDGINLPLDVREYIAGNVTSSIRELEGVMVSLVGHAAMLNCPITLDLAKTVVGNTVKVVQQRPINFDLLAQEVGSYYNIQPDVLFTKSRKREISDARQILMYLAKKIAKLPIVDIGKLLQRTHATVNYACNIIEERMQSDFQLQADISNIQTAILAH